MLNPINPPWVPRDDYIAFTHIYLHRYREVRGGPDGGKEDRERQKEKKRK